MENNHPCKVECQRRVHKGYANCVDEGQCDYAKLPERSLADEIPEWFEGGTCQQMLDEAFAQIRRLESLRSETPAQPKGWKLVPLNPTEAMFRAGDDASFEDTNFKEACKFMRKLWNTMLAAAPSPDGNNGSAT